MKIKEYKIEKETEEFFDDSTEKMKKDETYTIYRYYDYHITVKLFFVFFPIVGWMGLIERIRKDYSVFTLSYKEIYKTTTLKGAQNYIKYYEKEYKGVVQR